ncbi:MAG: RNA polymerase sigma-70 factor [Niabella sp.]
MSGFLLSNIIISISENDDEQAFKELFQHFYPGLLSYACSIVKSTEDAEEVVENVFLKIWEARAQLPAIQNFSHYLYTSAKNGCINLLQKNKKFVSNNDEEIEKFTYSFQTPESDLINAENLRLILEIVNTLPPKCRLIFRLVKEEKLSYDEVAQLLNISPRTVNAQMTIALSRIVEGLKSALPEFSSFYFRKKIK